ncbi:MAG: hypothetical protein AB8V10_06095 [Francisella endosymbiont of Hyalomma asiaticum]
MLKYLTQGKNKFTVVGDDDQSIIHSARFKT